MASARGRIRCSGASGPAGCGPDLPTGSKRRQRREERSCDRLAKLRVCEPVQIRLMSTRQLACVQSSEHSQEFMKSLRRLRVGSPTFSRIRWARSFDAVV
eukprot:s4395_g10.t1